MSSKLRIIALMIIAAALFGACDDGDSAKDSKSKGKSDIATPAPLEAGGEWVICTDVPYPPAEFQEGGEFVGYEVEMGEAIAELIGVEAKFQKTGFDGIIAALNANNCDSIISSMNVTEERQGQVDFVEYMTIGQAVAVAPDAEGSIESLDDLAGQVVAVQVGTTLKAAIDEANKELDDPIEVKTFPDAGAAAAALKNGTVDAFFADAPVVADYVNKDEASFAIGGAQIDELPAGIAIRKGDDELKSALEDAVDQLYEDGTMQEIFEKWSVDAFLLEPDDEDSDSEG